MDLLITELLEKLGKVMKTAKTDSNISMRMKRGIAAAFHLPDWRHVNLDKAFAYLKYLQGDEARLERFLDYLAEERAAEEQADWSALKGKLDRAAKNA